MAARVTTLNFISDAKAARCSRDGCYDEDMISGLAERLKRLEQSSVIVFHDMGSHGPAYWRRYPRRFSIDDKCLQTQRHRSLSHDNVYHTALGALGLRNAFYQRNLDLIGPCWRINQAQ